jgi:release factor glutamine methyltransferase
MKSHRSKSSDRERRWLLEEKYCGTESAAFRADSARLDAGEPVAYVIGHAPFLGLSIDLSSRPLIPRVETEYWLARTLTELKETRVSNILDVFCGSGCIGAAALARLPEARVDFADIEPAHFGSIRKTLQANGLDETRVRFFPSDVFSGVPGDIAYDVIFANPPYLSRERTERVGEGVLDYEPHEALFAVEDGMALIQRAVLGAPAMLSENGRLYVEHDDWQGEAVRDLFTQAGFRAVETWEDQYGAPRVTKGCHT